jgi:hypothetical protein
MCHQIAPCAGIDVEKQRFSILAEMQARDTMAYKRPGGLPRFGIKCIESLMGARILTEREAGRDEKRIIIG